MAACDFCNQHANEVEALIFSRLGHKVCQDCLLVCQEILEGEREPKPIRTNREVDPPSDIGRFLETLPERSQRSIDWCIRRVDRAMDCPAAPLTLNCGFCGGKGRFVAGPRVMICSSCVSVCRKLLSGDHARLVKLDVPQPVASTVLPPTEPDGWDQFSINQLVLLAVGLREELGRRHGAALATMSRTAATIEPGAIPGYDLHGGFTPETLLSAVNRTMFDCFAPGRLNIHLIGGYAGLRRSLAKRIHELSRCGRQFVRIDCRIRGWAAAMVGSEGGTLFLDYVEALTPEGMERLDMTARVDDRPVNQRLVTGASAVMALRGVALNLNDSLVPF